MRLGLQIRNQRIKIGMSQMDLASASGVSLPTLQNIERLPTANPSMQTLQLIFKEIGFDLVAQPQFVDWSYLAFAGLPISGMEESDGPASFTKTIRELRKLFTVELSYREQNAVAALLLAFEHHYPDLARRAFSNSVRRRFFPLFSRPEVLKLKRIATAKLAVYL